MMTNNEYIALFSFWCLLAVNQDKSGIQGSIVFDESDFEVWSKRLSNNEMAMIFFNRNREKKTFEIEWKQLGIKRDSQMFDIWENALAGTTKTTPQLTIPAHSVLFYKLINYKKE